MSTTRQFTAGAMDAQIYDTAPNTNTGAATSLTYGFTTVKSTSIYRAVMRFDVSRLSGRSKTITAARIIACSTGDTTDPGSQTFGCYKITTTGGTNYGTGWTEGGVTWNKYDGANNWGTAGGSFEATTPTPPTWSHAAVASGDFDMVPDSANFRAMVQDAIDNEAGILSVIVKRTSEFGPVETQNIATKENGSNPPPRLELTYTPDDVSIAFPLSPMRTMLVTR